LTTGVCTGGIVAAVAVALVVEVLDEAEACSDIKRASMSIADTVTAFLLRIGCITVAILSDFGQGQNLPLMNRVQKKFIGKLERVLFLTI
jgi:hypothetical protein